MELCVQPPVTVVGVEVEGDFEDLSTLVPEAWARWWRSEHLVADRTAATSTEVSFSLGGGRYREVLGARVATVPASLPEGLVAVELPEARSVTSTHEGAEEGIAARFGEMQAFAESNGERPDGVLVDDGYTPDGGGTHTLYVRLAAPD